MQNFRHSKRNNVFFLLNRLIRIHKELNNKNERIKIDILKIIIIFAQTNKKKQKSYKNEKYKLLLYSRNTNYNICYCMLLC